MADHELIRETMVSLGEGMQDCGYDAVLETIEGSGIVGRAVRNPREGDQLRIIILYLKDLAKTIKAQGPSQERAQAMQMLQDAWETMRAAVHEEEDEAMEKTRKENGPLPRQQRQQRPQLALPLPPRVAGKPQAVIVAPAPAASRPANAPRPAPGRPVQKPINGSHGNHYFRG
jgi:hypothetical protein